MWLQKRLLSQKKTNSMYTCVLLGNLGGSTHFGVWALESHKMRTMRTPRQSWALRGRGCRRECTFQYFGPLKILQSWALRGGGQAGVHILVFWALESSTMRTPRQSWALRGSGGQAGVSMLIFWALESSKMHAPRQSWTLRGWVGGVFFFFFLNIFVPLKVPKCVLQAILGSERVGAGGYTF